MQDRPNARWDHDRIIGAGLCLAAGGTVLAMSHHPTGMHGMPGSGDFVHGTMMALLAFIAFGLFHVALRRGIEKPWILAGALAYAISLFAYLGAATLNGFVAPALAARGPGAVGHDAFLVIWESNQALARIGVYATGVAYLLWSVDFLRGGGLMRRLTGLIGIAAGALPAMALFIGWLTMNLRGALLVYAAHALWVALVGMLLVRRGL